MLALTLRGLTARKLRAVLTALAIFFGVAMIAGTLMLTDTINKSFDNIFASANERTDVTISSTSDDAGIVFRTAGSRSVSSCARMMFTRCHAERAES